LEKGIDMLKIGEFAALTRISIRMLRHYDELGLLKPSHVDWESGYRYYTVEQLPRLNRIVALKDLGLTLAEIRLLLDDALSAEEIRGMLKLKQAQLRQHILDEKARLQRVEQRLRDIEQEGHLPETEIIVKPQADMHIISLCGSEWAGHLFQRANAVMNAHHLLKEIRGYLALYHGSMEYQRTGIRSREHWVVEVCYIIEPHVLDRIDRSSIGEMKMTYLPAYPHVASLVSTKTDHERHLDAQALWRWMAQHNYRLAAPSREIYLRRPSRSNPQAYLTEIMFPLESIVEEN
jgi:DNA-binding transcriptional MerR regulator